MRRRAIWVLTQRVHEGDNVVHAPLWGLARVAAAEHPKIFGGVLDVADAKLPVGALASLRGHPVVVMRDGDAKAARLAFAGRGAGAPMQCSAGGTYLITGGTGVLGLRMAQRLADIGARRLVLLSRTGMPDRSQWRDAGDSELIRTVAALEERGVSVHVAAARRRRAGRRRRTACRAAGTATGTGRHPRRRRGSRCPACQYESRETSRRRCTRRSTAR